MTYRKLRRGMVRIDLPSRSCCNRGKRQCPRKRHEGNCPSQRVPHFFSFVVTRFETLLCPAANLSLAALLANLIQQSRQTPHARCPDVRELPLVELANGRIKLFYQFQAAARDSRFHYAPVVALALPRDQLSLFHTVQQTSHIRVVRNHPLPDTAARQAVRLCTAQDAQYIVLRARQAV